jgi:hypothetical protein
MITERKCVLAWATSSIAMAHPVERGLSGRTIGGTDVLVFRPCCRFYDRLVDRWEATLAGLDSPTGDGSVVVLVFGSHQAVRAGCVMPGIRDHLLCKHNQGMEAKQ